MITPGSGWLIPAISSEFATKIGTGVGIALTIAGLTQNIKSLIETAINDMNDPNDIYGVKKFLKVITFE